MRFIAPLMVLHPFSQLSTFQTCSHYFQQLSCSRCLKRHDREKIKCLSLYNVYSSRWMKISKGKAKWSIFKQTESIYCMFDRGLVSFWNNLKNRLYETRFKWDILNVLLNIVWRLKIQAGLATISTTVCFEFNFCMLRITYLAEHANVITVVAILGVRMSLFSHHDLDLKGEAEFAVWWHNTKRLTEAHLKSSFLLKVRDGMKHFLTGLLFGFCAGSL